VGYLRWWWLHGGWGFHRFSARHSIYLRASSYITGEHDEPLGRGTAAPRA
jgi:hypothetical protein